MDKLNRQGEDQTEIRKKRQDSSVEGEVKSYHLGDLNDVTQIHLRDQDFESEQEGKATHKHQNSNGLCSSKHLLCVHIANLCMCFSFSVYAAEILLFPQVERQSAGHMVVFRRPY